MERNCKSENCKEVDNEFMVSCEKCHRWWHYSCVGFDPDKFTTSIPWFCEDAHCESLEDIGNNISKINPDDNNSFCEEIDNLLEAAATAQALVSQRDEELSTLRKEMEALKLKLAEAPSPPVQKVVDPPKISNADVVKERLQRIKKIQENHHLLLKSLVQSNNNLSVKKPENTHQHPIESTNTPSTSNRISVPDSDMATLLTILNRNNVQELPSFSGIDKREWPYFEEVYRSTTIEGRFSGKENVSRLRKALKGEAYQLVSDRLKYSSDSDAIMNSLRAIFGRHDVLVRDLTDDLMNLPRLTSKCDPRVQVWAIKLNGFVANLKSMGRNEDLNNGYVLNCLVSKLGAGLYQDWVKRKPTHTRANLQDFATFLTEKVVELPPDLRNIEPIESRKSYSKPKSGSILTHNSSQSPATLSVNCVCCNRNHKLSQCTDFKNQSVEQRMNFVREKRICFSCLDQSKHNWRTCRENKKCDVKGCKSRHHPLLNQKTSVSQLNNSATPFVPTSHVHSSHVRTDSAILFKIAPIRIYGANGKFVDTFAFLDDGSALSMVEKDLFDELGLSGTEENLILQWTKGVSRHEDSLKTSFSISRINNRKRYQLKNVYTVKNLELPEQSINVTELQRSFPHLRGLPISNLESAKPKILIGLDQAKFLWGHGQRHSRDEEPCAIKTLLGWVVYGKSVHSLMATSLNNASKPTMHFLFHDALKTEEALHDLVKQHFSTEEFGVKAPKGVLQSREVIRAIEIMERTLQQVDGQYEIGLLWKRDDIKLPDSFPMALNRLRGLEKSLKNKPHLLEWKNNHMKELLSKGYARKASKEELSKNWPRIWYAPTFIVENPNKVPSKPRDVADVAAKVNGVSLNTFHSC